MARFERLLIPIVLVIVVAAFLLEGAGPSGARIVALGVGLLLALAMVVGMWHRARRKGRAQPAEPARDQTSNDGQGGGGSPA